MSTPVVGLVTIGQSPRADVVPDMAAILGPGVAIRERGALDGLDVQITLDGGRTWNAVDVVQGYAAVSTSTACIGAGSPIFSGVSPLMTRYDVNLSQYAGRTGQLRFRFATDPLVDAPGAWVDNVTTSNVVVSVPDITCQ